mgnify:CR=1 FL=1|jgi:hypothetical protein|tara:strand:+ start:7550 stop:7756 length:207 start_codon:yes stop_codon:yes gene_type:complete
MLDMKDPKGFVDTALAKAISRKLMVWMAASWLLYLNRLTSEDWVAVSLVYLGIQGLVDLAAKWRSAGK